MHLSYGACYTQGASLKDFSRPEKLFCGNTNIMYAIAPTVQLGAVRGTLFFDQVRKDHTVVYSGTGVFF